MVKWIKFTHNIAVAIKRCINIHSKTYGLGLVIENDESEIFQQTLRIEFCEFRNKRKLEIMDLRCE